ncbi:UNVERIFIED_CONTAM: hypothetical protein GTU68_063708, partial [Idotea baltica]|nr:hypothetical protein [Idotea baltica]
MAIGKVRPAIQNLAAYRPDQTGVEETPTPRCQPSWKPSGQSQRIEPYQRPSSHELRAALADWLGVQSEQIAVGCGSVGLLQQLCLTYLDPGDEAIFPWLSFEAYPVCVKMMGGVPINPPLVDHCFDMKAVAEAVTDRTKMILLATPNNPTGTAITTEQIATLLASIPNNVIVLVDEAYREFADPALGDPLTDLLPNHRNLVISRTFSKAYGLAGLRVGYAITDPEIVLEMDKILLPFAVNSAAQAAALAALSSLDEIQVKIDQILAERTRVIASLS